MASSSSSSAGRPRPAKTTTIKLKAIDANPSNFAEFGQVVLSNAGNEFGPRDAQLDSDSQGISIDR